MLLKGQEAKEASFQTHFGSQWGINHQLRRSWALWKVLLPAAKGAKAGRDPQKSRGGRDLNASRDFLTSAGVVARFFYLSDFLIGSQLPEGN